MNHGNILRARMWISVMALTLLLGGCPRPPPPETVGKVPGRSDLAHLINQAGPDAAVVLVLRPGRWSAARSVLRKVATGRLKSVAAKEDPWSALGAALGTALGAPALSAWPAAPRGWDRRRPLVAGLLSPPPADPLSVTQAAASFAPMSFRSRVLVPATDAGALAGELAQLLGKLGCGPPRQPRHAPAGGTTLVCQRAQTAVWIRTQGRRVTLDLLHSGRLEQDELKVAFTSLRPPAAAVRSPSLRFLEASRGLLTIYTRPWQLRAAYLYINAMRIPAACAGSDPDRRGAMMAMGISELFQLLMATAPGEAELDDLALDLLVEAPSTLRARSVLTLSGHGEALLRRAAVTDALKPAATPKQRPALVRVRHRLDLTRLPKGSLVPGQPIKEALRVIAEQGVGWFLFLRKPLRVLGAARRLGMLEGLSRMEREAKVELLSLRRARLPAGVLARYEIQKEQLDRLRLLETGLSIHGRLAWRGRALTHDTLLTRATGEPSFSAPWPGTGASAAPPRGAATAQACLARLYGMLSTLFDGVSSADPAKRQELLVSTPGSAKEALACALADPATRERARGAQAVLLCVTLSRHMLQPLSTAGSTKGVIAPPGDFADKVPVPPGK